MMLLEAGTRDGDTKYQLSIILDLILKYLTLLYIVFLSVFKHSLDFKYL